MQMSLVTFQLEYREDVFLAFNTRPELFRVDKRNLKNLNSWNLRSGTTSQENTIPKKHNPEN